MHQDRIENFIGIGLGPYQKFYFWYHEIMVTSPHTKKSEMDRL